MRQPSDQKREKKIAIALAVLMAAVMVSLGVWSIVSGFSTGSTRKGVASFDGASARWMGAIQASIGMIPLAVAMPSKKAAIAWVLGWLAIAAGCFLAAIFLVER